jgi:hypothetical protein
MSDWSHLQRIGPMGKRALALRAGAALTHGSHHFPE